MADAILKRTDIGGTLDIPLERWDYVNQRWVPIDLTQAESFRFLMKGTSYGVVAGGCAVTGDPVNGVVRVTFDEDDLQHADDYNAEVEIAWPGGSRETVPNGASGLPIGAPGQIYLEITVLADLDTTPPA